MASKKTGLIEEIGKYVFMSNAGGRRHESTTFSGDMG
jgi:hypothetical protein